jgi:hypothetical protein
MNTILKDACTDTSRWREMVLMGGVTELIIMKWISLDFPNADHEPWCCLTRTRDVNRSKCSLAKRRTAFLQQQICTCCLAVRCVPTRDTLHSLVNVRSVCLQELHRNAVNIRTALHTLQSMSGLFDYRNYIQIRLILGLLFTRYTQYQVCLLEELHADAVNLRLLFTYYTQCQVCLITGTTYIGG